MSGHVKSEIVAAIESDGIVPVFHSSRVETAIAVAGTLFSAGLSTFEFTNRSDRASHVFEGLTRWADEEAPHLVIGAGTIIDADAANEMIDLGAAFVFGPTFSEEVAAVCSDRDVLYVPGCATPTEIQTAYRHGCELVKLFPAHAIGGPSFLRAIRAPCPWVRAIPTGGLEPTDDSLRAWFEAGATAVGLGSKLIPPAIVEQEDWQSIARTARQVIAVARAVRGAE